ncbi:MAG: gluconate 2-dehydrogenase subunit 3 family protein [Terriglobia bacterium]
MSDQENEKRPGQMNRRSLLKAITAAPAAALIPVLPSRAAGVPAPQGAAASEGPYKPRVFNAHDWKTLHVLSDWIIPADERSGSATDAGVPEFIDDLLTLNRGQVRSRRARGPRAETASDPRTEIVGGLAWLDSTCNRDYGHDFVDCPTAVQKQMLDRIAYAEKAAPDDAPGAAFFGELRQLVLMGFYSSKLGVQDLQYMGNKMLTEWNGCPDNVIARLGVDYSDWKKWKA